MLMLVDVTPGTFAVVVDEAFGEELQAANKVAPSVTPRAPVTSTRAYLPMEVWLLCLIASPFLMACCRTIVIPHLTERSVPSERDVRTLSACPHEVRIPGSRFVATPTVGRLGCRWVLRSSPRSRRRRR